MLAKGALYKVKQEQKQFKKPRTMLLKAVKLETRGDDYKGVSHDAGAGYYCYAAGRCDPPLHQPRQHRVDSVTRTVK